MKLCTSGWHRAGPGWRYATETFSGEEEREREIGMKNFVHPLNLNLFVASMQ